jgi:vacuolar-type H+-ATPase subunit E/Vma4
MDAIGGDTPKFVQVAESEEEKFASTSVRIEVSNPHGVVIGEVVVEVRDEKVHVTPSSAHKLEFVFHVGRAGPA